MERLTHKCESTGQYYILDKNTPYEELVNIAIDRLAEYENTKLSPEQISLREDDIKLLQIQNKEFREEILKLQEGLSGYRDAEEQGRLVNLPCKVGDIVYWISYFNSGINTGTVYSMKISKFGIDIEISSGTALFWREYEKIFLTREAAEEALKPLSTKDDAY